jgi:hypothetical protein
MPVLKRSGQQQEIGERFEEEYRHGD